MPDGLYPGLRALELVRSSLIEDAYLPVVQENANRWNAYFTFEDPAGLVTIREAEQQLGVHFPKAYIELLLHYNGARLYVDKAYGQWGFLLCGVDTLVAKNDYWKSMHEDRWPASYLVFAESLGDSNTLVLDTDRLTIDGTDCTVMNGENIFSPKRWKAAARSLSDWLDHLVVAQGTKYWDWVK